MDALSALQRLGRGMFFEELADAITEVAAEVVETGKPGTVTVTLKVSNGHQGDPMVFVNEAISRKPPTSDPRGTFFFHVDGALHQDDPRQPQLTFRTVDPPSGEVRESTRLADLREAN